MASYPGAKVHRTGNRRKLGRGQTPAYPSPVLVVSAFSADVMRITSNEPVVWGPSIAATVATRTLVSQAVFNQFIVDITFSGAVATLAYTVPSGAGTSYFGGPTPAVSGTF